MREKVKKGCLATPHVAGHGLQRNATVCAGARERQAKLRELGVQKLLQSLLITSDTTLFDKWVLPCARVADAHGALLLQGQDGAAAVLLIFRQHCSDRVQCTVTPGWQPPGGACGRPAAPGGHWGRGGAFGGTPLAPVPAAFARASLDLETPLSFGRGNKLSEPQVVFVFCYLRHFCLSGRRTSTLVAGTDLRAEATFWPPTCASSCARTVARGDRSQSNGFYG